MKRSRITINIILANAAMMGKAILVFEDRGASQVGPPGLRRAGRLGSDQVRNKLFMNRTELTDRFRSRRTVVISSTV
jgi:hypothetical protein